MPLPCGCSSLDLGLGHQDTKNGLSVLISLLQRLNNNYFFFLFKKPSLKTTNCPPHYYNGPKQEQEPPAQNPRYCVQRKHTLQLSGGKPSSETGSILGD